jgi:hypothetical protein
VPAKRKLSFSVLTSSPFQILPSLPCNSSFFFFSHLSLALIAILPNPPLLSLYSLYCFLSLHVWISATANNLGKLSTSVSFSLSSSFKLSNAGAEATETRDLAPTPNLSNLFEIGSPLLFSSSYCNCYRPRFFVGGAQIDCTELSA